MGGKFHDSIRKSIFYTNLGADRRGFDRNARIESPKHSLRFQLGHGFGSGMRKKEEAANEAVCSGVIARGETMPIFIDRGAPRSPAPKPDRLSRENRLSAASLS